MVNADAPLSQIGQNSHFKSFKSILRVRLHSQYYLDILSGYQYPDILHSEFIKFTN